MKAENVLKVINNFESILPEATMPGHLNMLETGVHDSKHVCGTIHCHAGWYAVALIKKGEKFGDPSYISFIDGANLMGRDLGFDTRREISRWAVENPDIWGNEDGDIMFGSRNAFKSSKRPKGATCLQDIIDHWKEVYQRLLALENPEEKREDITAKLAILPVDETLDTIKTQVYEHV